MHVPRRPLSIQLNDDDDYFFQTTTMVLSAEYNSTVSCILPVILKMITRHMTAKDNDSPVIVAFKEAVSTDLPRRFFQVHDPVDVHVVVKASVLDSRFKKLKVLPKNARKAAHDAVKADMKLEYEHHTFDTEEEEVPPPKKAATAMDVLMVGV